MKIYMSDKLGGAFKEQAMKRFGYGRGSISKAAEEAITRWLIETEKISRKLDAVVNAAKADKDVVAVILFGSYGRKEYAYRDVDVAILLDEKADRQKALLKYASAVDNFENRLVDISILNDLPLDIQSRIFNEAVVLYAKDNAKLYDYSISLIKRWSDFKPRLSIMVSK